MEKLNKKTTTILVVFILSFTSAAAIFFFWKTIFQKEQDRASMSLSVIETSQELLSRKAVLEAEWNSKKVYLNEGIAPDELLNNWIKEILAYAQTQSIKIDKIEPAGIRQEASEKKSLIFLTFQGNIRQWTDFVYYLMESDPMVVLESFTMKREDASNLLSVELMLGKGLS